MKPILQFVLMLAVAGIIGAAGQLLGLPQIVIVLIVVITGLVMIGYFYG